MSVQMPKDLEVDMSPSHHPPTHNSCHSIDSDPFDNLENPVPCRLAISCGLLKIVTIGMVYPTHPKSVVHHQQIMVNHVKVFVDDIVPGEDKSLLPTPSRHYAMVGEAIGSFVQWPNHLVILGKETTISKVTKDDKGKKE